MQRTTMPALLAGSASVSPLPDPVRPIWSPGWLRLYGFGAGYRHHRSGGDSPAWRDAFQEIDITGLTMPVTKHNFLVRSVADLAGVIRNAFAIAREGRPGPVLIDVPRDVLLAEVDFTAKQADDSAALSSLSVLPPIDDPENDVAINQAVAALLNSRVAPCC